MSYFDKKKKKRPFFDIGDFEEIMDSMFKQLMDKDFDSFKPRKPLVMGFSMRTGPDGKPVMQEFGNIKSRQGKPFIAQQREPLTDVKYSDKEVVITAELPGVEKKDIKVEPVENKLVVLEAKGVASFYKEIALESPVKPRTAKAVFKNGILEVRFKKAREKASKKSVRVE